MTLIAFDSETTGLTSEDRLVVVSVATKEGVKLYTPDEGVAYLATCLELGDSFVGHNIAFDWTFVLRHSPELMPLVFEAYATHRVHDTEVREKLLNIADGTLRFEEDEDGNPIKVGYSLGALASKYTSIKLDKGEDSWRTRYSDLEGVALVRWPEAARHYAEQDARSTRDVFLAQKTRSGGGVTNEFDQVRAAFCLKLMSNHGMRTDPVAVEELAKKLDIDSVRLQGILIEAGLMRAPRPLKSGPRKGELTEASKDMAAITERVVKAYEGRDLLHTETGRPSTNRKTLKLSRDPVLESLAEYGAVDKIRGTYLPVLRSGATKQINPGFNVLVATGRTSSYEPNFQNLPRDGGVRECFVPSPGSVYVFCDYAAVELRTLAQTCIYLGLESELAKAFNEGLDPHTALAAEMLGLDYEATKLKVKAGDKEAKKARQAAKALNFGFPGGLGAKKFVDYAADSYGVVMTLAEAERRRKQWFARWPEMAGYFKHVEKWSRRGWVQQFVSNRIRGGVGYCDSANSPFQGLAADGIKASLFNVTRSCYLERNSALFGSRPVNMIHDEIVLEAPEDKASEAAEELSRLMIQGMSVYVPDVKIETSLAMARRWYKSAEEVRDSSGRLVCWEPKEEAKAA